MVFMLLLAISLLGSTVYRGWIYSNGINDCHLADFLPSLMSVPVAYSLVRTIQIYKDMNSRPKFREIFYLCIGYLIYESLQLLGYGFDIYDCIATVFGAIITYITAKMADKCFENL